MVSAQSYSIFLSFLDFLKKVCLFIICKYTVVVFRHQKRTFDLITDGCEPLCGCWDLNSGPSVEQSVLLTAEPSISPALVFCFFETGFHYVALAVMELTQ